MRTHAEGMTGWRHVSTLSPRLPRILWACRSGHSPPRGGQWQPYLPQELCKDPQRGRRLSSVCLWACTRLPCRPRIMSEPRPAKVLGLPEGRDVMQDTAGPAVCCGQEPGEDTWWVGPEGTRSRQWAAEMDKESWST